MAAPARRASAFIGPATAQRPRRRSSHDLCEGCGHFRSEHRSGQSGCRHDGCECPQMGWTPPEPLRAHTKTQITDEIKAQMEALLQAGMNYRKVAAIIGCSRSAVRTHFPGYGDNGRADVQAHREVYKARQHRHITKHIESKKNRPPKGNDQP